MFQNSVLKQPEVKRDTSKANYGAESVGNCAKGSSYWLRESYYLYTL